LFRAFPAPPFLAPLAAALLVAVTTSLPAWADDAVDDFNQFANTTTNRWCYGITPTLGGAFTLLPTAITDAGLRKGWTNGTEQIMKNVTTIPLNIGGTNVPPGVFTLEPKTLTSFVVARWLAPSSGAATIVARFERLSTSTGQSAQVAILYNSTTRVLNRWMV